jgi:hypothetical protein
MMKKFLLLAAIGGLVFATSMAPAEAAPRNRAADGTEAAASTTQRSQSTRNRSTSQGQKANRQNRSSSSGNKANRNRAPRTPPAEG